MAREIKILLVLAPILVLAGCGSYGNVNIPGTYDVLYTPLSVSISFPEESPVTGTGRDGLISLLKVPCDQEHFASEPPYETVYPKSFTDVLSISLDGESIAAVDGSGHSYAGILTGNKAEIEASVVLPDTAADAAVPDMGLYPETTGTAKLEIEFKSDGFDGIMGYTLDIDTPEIILADCSSSYDAKGAKRK
jgi:hypothetical protein